MPPDNCIGMEENDRSRWGKVLERALTTTAVDSRAFRAGVILNPLRGLTAVENNAFHFERDVPSPVQPTDKIGYLLVLVSNSLTIKNPVYKSNCPNNF